MSVEDRTEWLMVATEAFDAIPASLFLEACQFVGPRVDHPAKIAPALLAYVDEHREAWEYRNRPQVAAPRLAVVPRAPPPPPEPITAEQIAEMSPSMIRIGLGCGALARDADGNVVPAP